MGLFDFFKKKDKEKEQIQEKPVSPMSIETDDIIPIENRIQGKAPSCDGLYPHEILVLSYAKKFCTEGNKFQGFWWYQYGLRDVQEVLDSLFERGYIQLGTLADAINLEKVPAIKEVLKQHNLKVTGRKADLINRLLENVDNDELKARFTKTPYALTDAGKAILTKYEWIPYIHSHGIDGLDIWNLTEMIQTPPRMKYRDKIWSYMNKISLDYAQKHDFGLYRNMRFRMSEFLIEENKIEEAFALLCEVITYDLSGLDNGFEMEYLSIMEQFFFPYEKSNVTMAPGITNRVKKYASDLGWDEEELVKKLQYGISKFKLPFSIFTNDEKVDIVMSEIHGDKEALNKIYTGAEKRYKKMHRIK